MNMIDVMQRLAELDAANPNVIKENVSQKSGMAVAASPAGQNNYNFTTSIHNPAYDAWENGAGDENNPPPETIEVGINYSISSDSDESGRFSEISQYSIHDLSTGQEINITDKNVLGDVEDDIWKDAKSSKDDDYGIPDRGDYYENAEGEDSTFDIHFDFSTKARNHDELEKLQLGLINYIEARVPEIDHMVPGNTGQEGSLFTVQDFEVSISASESAMAGMQNKIAQMIKQYPGVVRVNPGRIDPGRESDQQFAEGEDSTFDIHFDFSTKARNHDELEKLQLGLINYIEARVPEIDHMVPGNTGQEGSLFTVQDFEVSISASESAMAGMQNKIAQMIKQYPGVVRVNPGRIDPGRESDQQLAELRRLLGNKTPVSECGMMPGMAMSEPSQPRTPASINMTAASGPELSGMLRDIMQLAGMNNAPSAPSPMTVSPQMLEPVGNMSPADSMRGVIDKMNPADDMGQDFDDNGEDDVNQAHGDLDNDGDHDMDDHNLEKKQPVDEYDNTPADPNKKNKFDANQFANRQNQPGQGDRMDGTSPKAYADMNEAVSDLFAQYKKFVNESTDMQAEDAVADFMAKGGKVQQLAPRPPRKSEKTNFGSKHIGGRRDAVAGKAGKTLGRAATTNFKGNSKPVVGM